MTPPCASGGGIGASLGRIPVEAAEPDCSSQTPHHGGHETRAGAASGFARNRPLGSFSLAMAFWTYAFGLSGLRPSRIWEAMMEA